jgi:hypothetical protein
MSQGLSKGQMEKMERRVQRRLDKGVPWSLWDYAEQQYHAFYFTGGACPSSGTLQNVQVTEKRRRKDLP